MYCIGQSFLFLGVKFGRYLGIRCNVSVQVDEDRRLGGSVMVDLARSGTLYVTANFSDSARVPGLGDLCLVIHV